MMNLISKECGDGRGTKSVGNVMLMSLREDEKKARQKKRRGQQLVNGIKLVDKRYDSRSVGVAA